MLLGKGGRRRLRQPIPPLPSFLLLITMVEKSRAVAPDKSCLPSCFGISTTVWGCGGTMEKRRFSLRSLRMRKSAVTKTVPVDVAGVQKPTLGAPGGAQADEKPEGKRRIPGHKSPPAASFAVAVADADAVGKSRKPTNEMLPPAVDVKPPECASSTSKDSAPRRTGASRTSGQRHDRKTEKVNGGLDPVVGLSVLTVVLAIMLLWGRTCAILCTSAWFYFIPRLRDTAGYSGEVAGIRTEAGNVDVDSEEYKKKVILEGLLERNRRLRP